MRAILDCVESIGVAVERLLLGGAEFPPCVGNGSRLAGRRPEMPAVKWSSGFIFKERFGGTRAQ